VPPNDKSVGTIDVRFLRRLRTAGFVEGCSTLVLFFIAMPLKYFAGMPLAVTIVGGIHGFLFLLLVALFIAAVKKVPLALPLAVAGVFGAVIPFGPFVVDRWLARLAP
jgi:integral membrane protein